ncbi:MAG: heparinase II/III-family protein [Candidatus Thiothrix putei]|uniref:Heparinase II/III-family protein n=1 Tax=Candidatus Thiothrix putei TaxID=3080811 RepID=A0AA95KK14_9GAMM|nr:MAG: heparinase II/III-family protein [Candidatus Thiothrix putei]
MNSQRSKARTILALGIPNLSRVLGYRLSVKLGINPVRRIRAQLPIDDTFFTPFTPRGGRVGDGGEYPLTYFGWHTTQHRAPPNWHQNSFNSVTAQANLPWWQIPDFDPKLGDIKTVWEASRFDWVIHFAQQALQGNETALDNLNHWLSDWCTHNPAYYGVNWKCGQETSIRVMHLAFAALLLQQHQQASPALQTLIKAHLQRIAPTIHYAIAQDNNHGTSEAAALFIGGSWLHYLGDSDGKKWQRLGIKWLENRAKRLIEVDGSFSQYSVNYHRVMLDTYSMAEHWRRCLNLPTFSAQLYQQLQRATNWLYQMTQAETGDAPNLGANDGARLLPLNDIDYRDFRPAVQLAMALFCHRWVYSSKGDLKTPLHWLGIPIPQTLTEPPRSIHFANGGYSLMRQGNHFALLRFPCFRFRPSQADALHVDLWVAGQNLLRDAGTYSYNAGDETTQYFGGTASHNTIQFDDRDQMPRLSRFLFGEWLKANDVIPVHEQHGIVSTAAGYCDYQGAAHHRTVTLSINTLSIKDTVSGFTHKAVLRWRLQPSTWVLDESGISNGNHRITIRSSVPILRMEITQGWESRYYLQKTTLPVLEVEIHQAGELTTEYHFNS